MLERMPLQCGGQRGADYGLVGASRPFAVAGDQAGIALGAGGGRVVGLQNARRIEGEGNGLEAG